jgi:ornithine decarboxylase
MIPRDVKSPTRAIPLHKLLNGMAIVDPNDAQTKELLDYIKTDGFEVEVCEDFEDASELMSLVDGDGTHQVSHLRRSRVTLR